MLAGCRLDAIWVTMSSAGSCGTQAITWLADPSMLSLPPQDQQVTAKQSRRIYSSITIWMWHIRCCMGLELPAPWCSYPIPSVTVTASTALQNLFTCQLLRATWGNGYQTCSSVFCCSQCLHLCRCQPTSVLADSGLETAPTCVHLTCVHLHVCTYMCLTLKTACVLLYRLQLHVHFMLKTACMCVHQQVWPQATMGWTGKGCLLHPRPPPLPLPLRIRPRGTRS